MIVRVAITLTAVLAFLIPGLALAQGENAVIQNDFIRVVVNGSESATGRFSMDTTGGDPRNPATKNQQLIYGGAAPWTSFTTVQIDGTNYVFGGRTERRAGKNANYGELVSAPAVKDDVITTTYKFDEILVTQEITLVRGTSRMLDTARIAYRISNKGTSTHQVGLRMLLDTKLGPNDGAPVRVINQSKPISTPVAIDGGDLPAFWLAFDNYDNPTVVSQGIFAGEGSDATRPDNVVYADWGTLADNVWEPELNTMQGFHRKWEGEDFDPEAAEEDLDELDTACALYWNAAPVAAGKQTTLITNYGMGYMNPGHGILSILSNAPADTTFEYERTQPFSVTAFLKNSGDFDAKNAVLKLILPEGLTLVGGSKQTQTIPDFKVKDEFQSSWILMPTGKVSGEAVIRIKVSSDNVEGNEATVPIQIFVPKPRLVLSPNAQTVALKTTNRPTIVPIKVNLSPAVDFYGAKVTLSYNPDVMTPVVISRGSELIENGRLLGGWEYYTEEDGKITLIVNRGDAPKLTQAEINLAVITFCTTGEGKSPLVLEQAVLVNENGDESPVATSAGQVEVKAQPIR